MIVQLAHGIEARTNSSTGANQFSEERATTVVYFQEAEGKKRSSKLRASRSNRSDDEVMDQKRSSFRIGEG